MTSEEISKIQNELLHFTGTERWFRFPLIKKYLYTEGVQYVAKTCGAYWLIDEIFFSQKTHKFLLKEEFQIWKLTVKDSQGILTCEDGNGGKLLKKDVPFTDFPLPEIEFYFTDNILLLPSEH